MTGSRISDLQTFYALLGSLEERVGGARTLATCSGRLEWPRLRMCSARPRGCRGAQKDYELTPSDVGHRPLPPWSDHRQPMNPSRRSAAPSAFLARESLGQI
jgi:hypothetical protein